MRAVTRPAGKLGQPVDSEVHFAGAATELVVTHLRGDLAIEVLLADEIEVGTTWVKCGYDSIGANLVAVFERDTNSLAVLYDDFADGRPGDDLGAVRLRGPGNRDTDAPGAAFG